jgi:hypothetical protein
VKYLDQFVTTPPIQQQRVVTVVALDRIMNPGRRRPLYDPFDDIYRFTLPELADETSLGAVGRLLDPLFPAAVLVADYPGWTPVPIPGRPVDQRLIPTAAPGTFSVIVETLPGQNVRLALAWARFRGAW